MTKKLDWTDFPNVQSKATEQHFQELSREGTNQGYYSQPCVF